MVGKSLEPVCLLGRSLVATSLAEHRKQRDAPTGALTSGLQVTADLRLTDQPQA